MNASDSLGKRIREGEKSKIPYLLVLGDKEKDATAVTVRNIISKEQVEVSLEEFMEKTVADITRRSLQPSIGS